MNNRFLRITAASASCMLIASAFCSCAAETGDSYGNYADSNSYSDYEYEFKDESESSKSDSAAEESFEGNDEAPEVSEVSPNEEYSVIQETGFKNPKEHPLSTFSADIDTASYSNVRRLIEDASAIPDGAVRIEEFLNYFDYDFPQPEKGEIFSRYAEIADCPWNPESKLMMLGIQGMEIEEKEAPPSNLVFLIDSSGSMANYNKLPLVQNAFSMLAERLSDNDRVSIVTYSNSARNLICGASAREKDNLLEAMYSIEANGGTNGELGIKRAYEIAEEYFIEGGNNRVIIATDGDLNAGASTRAELEELIKNYSDSGIYLSVLGFGTRNIKDNLLETLAHNGNGNYSYIDSADEAQRVLVNEMSGTLYTIAKDVKIQVEFNPAQVESYRLLGYDNRIMDAHDFVDESKDAGDVGSGHSVTALYEIKLTDNSSYDGIPLEFADEHETLPTEAKGSRKELCKFSVAYKDVKSEETEYLSTLFGMEKYSENPTDNLKLASAVAEFAMLLKDSEFKGSSSYNYIAEALSQLDGKDEKIAELAKLSQTAAALYE